MASSHSLSHSLGSLRRLGEHSSADLTTQLAELAHDVAEIAASLGKQAKPVMTEAGRSAGELAEQLAHQLAPVARRFRHDAKIAGRMVRDDPVPAVVAIGTVALLATLLLARR